MEYKHLNYTKCHYKFIYQLKSLKASKKQIKIYKGVFLEEIYQHMIGKGSKMTKAEVDKEIKINADFPYDSCADLKATKDDMANLIVWAFIYGDEQGIHVDYPEDKEIDKKLNLNFNRK